MQMLFRLCYKRYLEANEVGTTMRVGDKVSSYPKGRELSIIVGSRFKPQVLGYAEVTKAESMKFGEVTDKLLKTATPDARTKEGMRCSMWLTTGEVVEDDTVVTLVNFKPISAEEIEKKKQEEAKLKEQKKKEKEEAKKKKAEERAKKKAEKEAKKLEKQKEREKKKAEREAKKKQEQAEKSTEAPEVEIEIPEGMTVEESDEEIDESEEMTIEDEAVSEETDDEDNDDFVDA